MRFHLDRNLFLSKIGVKAIRLRSMRMKLQQHNLLKLIILYISCYNESCQVYNTCLLSFELSGILFLCQFPQEWKCFGISCVV